MIYDRTLRCFFSLMIMLVCACDDGADSPGGDTDTQGVSISASEVAADPVAPVNSTNAQAWLESLLQLHQQQATAIQQLQETTSGHADRLDALESTNVDVDAVSLVAAEVGFDDESTSAKGTTVQTFGEALDHNVTQVTSIITALETSLTETKDHVTGTQQEIITINKTLGSHEFKISQVKGETDNLWETVQPLLDLAAQPCPPEMVLVANMVCVDKKKSDFVQPEQKWIVAANECTLAGKRLCSPSEFWSYCVDAAKYIDPADLMGPNTLAGPEWMDQLTGPGFMAFRGGGAAGCSTMEAVSANDDNYFRCCKPPKPTLPE